MFPVPNGISGDSTMWGYSELRSCWRRLIASGVGLWLSLAQGLPAQTPAKKYAVLVGINQYLLDRLPALSYAVNGVTGLSQVLEKSGYEVSLLCDRLSSPVESS
jgi:hypothetical protein